MRKILSLVLGLLWALPAFAALPSGYTQLEYIQSTGTQYIDTGIVPNQDTSVRLDAQYLNYNSGSNGILFGARTSSMVNVYVVQRLTAGDWNMGYNNGSVIVGTADTNRHIFYKNKQYQYLDGELKGTGTYSAFTCPGTAILFGFNNNGTPNTTDFPAKVYSLKIYENNTLVRDFVPAKNASGVVGMYDTVNNRFYTNAGSGEFIAGDPVTTCNGTIVNYTSATGTGVQNGTPTPDNPIYPTFYKQGNMVLRKVGDYADSYDATTGKITRRVGVKVLDGTEDWRQGTNTNTFTLDNYFSDIKDLRDNNVGLSPYYTVFSRSSGIQANITDNSFGWNTSFLFVIKDARFTELQDFQTWLREKNNAGTPVTVWYPLKTETTEDWPASYCETPIKIATTKYNETKFSPLNTALANAISVVDSVVSNTITQAGRIATLQTQKQTRPNDIADDNEKCPAGKKCLLVEDTSGVPHWYEIVERYSRLPEGFTELQWIQSTGSQWVNTEYKMTSDIVEYGIEIYGAPTSSTSLFGSETSSGITYSGVPYASGSSVSVFIGRSSALGGVIFPASQWNTYTIKTTSATNLSVTLNGNTRDGVYSGGIQKEKPLYLFANNNDGNTQKASIRVRSFYIKDNGALVRDFVPAQNSDGKIGMYDLANGVFYENAGDGEFVAGPVAE